MWVMACNQAEQNFFVFFLTSRFMFLALRLKHEFLRNFQQVEKRDRFLVPLFLKAEIRPKHIYNFWSNFQLYIQYLYTLSLIFGSDFGSAFGSAFGSDFGSAFGSAFFKSGSLRSFYEAYIII
jgi:hypothetical protein